MHLLCVSLFHLHASPDRVRFNIQVPPTPTPLSDSTLPVRPSAGRDKPHRPRPPCRHGAVFRALCDAVLNTNPVPLRERRAPPRAIPPHARARAVRRWRTARAPARQLLAAVPGAPPAGARVAGVVLGAACARGAGTHASLPPMRGRGGALRQPPRAASARRLAMPWKARRPWMRMSASCRSRGTKSPISG
jgi:hypothetical protein